MNVSKWSELLWGQRAKVSYLLFASVIILLTMLGGREIWTQEHRWADIVAGMFYRHDFFHPYLGENDYYDKPLLSYWMAAAIAWMTGSLSTLALRLPSALAGLLAVFSIYRLGSRLKNFNVGLVAGWMLLTTFYFVFWARTSSADMLNLAGSLFAVAWYFDKKEQPSFFNFSIFFLILALTSLCKGLVGAVVPALVILPDLIHNNAWKKYFNFTLVLSMLPAIIVYVAPFWASDYFSGNNYGENGLYLVYRENILRYFQPFDHKGPVYTYFIFLPVYLLPWACFFIPALFSLKNRWREMDWHSKWMCWSVLVLFLFFTLSGSRRSYYVLPMVPFAILLTADWIVAAGFNARRYVFAFRVMMVFLFLFFLNFDVLQPLYYARGGLSGFASTLKTEVAHAQPWEKWNVVLLDAESKNRFYLQLPPTVKTFNVKGELRKEQTTQSLLVEWPFIKNPRSNVIYISRASYVPLLETTLKQHHYAIISAPPSLGERILHIKNPNAPVAFVPEGSLRNKRTNAKKTDII